MTSAKINEQVFEEVQQVYLKEWEAEELNKEDLGGKFWNPEGHCQVYLEKFEGKNKLKEFRLEKLWSSSYLVLGLGVYWLANKFTGKKLPAVKKVATVLLGVRLYQFLEVAEYVVWESLGSLQVLRWLLSGTGGNVIGTLLACREKLTYIELRLQDSQVQSSDVARSSREFPGTEIKSQFFLKSMLYF